VNLKQSSRLLGAIGITSTIRSCWSSEEGFSFGKRDESVVVAIRTADVRCLPKFRTTQTLVIVAIELLEPPL
jgi:hypothetical protein